MDRTREALISAQPDFVYLGLPFPKASALVADLRPHLPRTWFLGLGISFSFVCGEVERAPRWMQSSGLEWLHRLRQEPRRLARRYLVEGGPMAMRLFWRSYRERGQS
jgi:N-acetylglucosaminyldiphosphoundecaprenol N-acetyl-beta-D-mannosaminyltransferase